MSVAFAFSCVTPAAHGKGACSRATVLTWTISLALALSAVDDGQVLLRRIVLAVPVAAEALSAAVVLRGHRDFPLLAWLRGRVAAAALDVLGSAGSLTAASLGGFALG